jgi:hypothetical protein
MVRTNVQPRTADDGDDLLPPTDAERVGRPGMVGKIIGNGLFALLQADVLMAADRSDHLHATEHRRGAVDKRRGPIEGVCRETVHPHVRMLRCELG